MARFHGKVGFGETQEVTPGVFADVIVEHTFMGDVIQNRRILRQGDNLNKDLSLSNSISIVASAYANEHYFAIRYVVWQGVRWVVSDVSVEPPRLVLELGEVYNGPTPA